MCIAIECSYKLDQKNEFKFLCELCTFLQIRSHIAIMLSLPGLSTDPTADTGGDIGGDTGMKNSQSNVRSALLLI